jgi:hypothetical protein
VTTRAQSRRARRQCQQNESEKKANNGGQENDELPGHAFHFLFESHPLLDGQHLADRDVVEVDDQEAWERPGAEDA